MNDNLDVLFYSYYKEKEKVPQITTNLIYSTNLDYSEEKKRSILRKSIVNVVLILLFVISISSGIAVYASKRIREKTPDGKTIIYAGEDISDITEPTEVTLKIPVDSNSRVFYTDEELKEKNLQMQKESIYSRYKYLMEDNNGFERKMTEQEYVYFIEQWLKTVNEISGTGKNEFSKVMEVGNFLRECLGRRTKEKDGIPMTTYEVEGKEYKVIEGGRQSWLVQKRQIFKEMVRNRLAATYGEEYINDLMDKVDSYYDIPIFKVRGSMTIVVSDEEKELFERIDELINSGNYEEIELPALLSFREEYNILQYMIRSDEELALRLKVTYMSREKLRGKMDYKYRHSFPENPDITEEMYSDILNSYMERPDWSDDRLYESIPNHPSNLEKATNTLAPKPETDSSQNIFVNNRVRE